MNQSPNMVIDHVAETVTYGPCALHLGQSIGDESLINDAKTWLRERVAMLEGTEDAALLSEGRTVGQWRQWFSMRKDG